MYLRAMPFPPKGSQRTHDTPLQKYRKLLWGINQNRTKLQKLAEMTTVNIENAQELAKKRNARLGDKKASPTAMRISEDIQRLQLEMKILKQLIQGLEDCQKRWPTLKHRGPRISGLVSQREKGRPLILLIDDERITLKSLEHFLRQENYSVVASRSAEEGLQKAFDVKPDLILLDIMMPGMTGYQFLDALKEEASTASIPVILLSSLSRESDILEGLDKGAIDYIVKPYSPHLLITKVNRTLSTQDEDTSDNRRL